MRGREELVICDNCGRKVPRNKAVAYEKVVSFSTDLHTSGDVKFFERKKVYYCISCAKHLGIFEKKKAQAARRSGV
ncbi:MAG: hypothetical protein ACP5T4_02390 [Candidatus Micrarchaeia archaeon]